MECDKVELKSGVFNEAYEERDQGPEGLGGAIDHLFRKEGRVGQV